VNKSVRAMSGIYELGSVKAWSRTRKMFFRLRVIDDRGIRA
jgi:hypothetical protein